jgi:hypothetical protein
MVDILSTFYVFRHGFGSQRVLPASILIPDLGKNQTKTKTKTKRKQSVAVANAAP